jgi:hypothetical protein
MRQIFIRENPMSRTRKINPKSQKEQPKKSNVPYILFDKGRHLWRANPADPYIYVSFSSKQFYQAYASSDPMAKYLYDGHEKSGVTSPSVDLQEGVKSKFKDVLQDEWVNKAGVPLKFLPDNAPVSDIRSKNVCFMLSRNIPLDQITTYPMTHPTDTSNNPNIPSHYKVTHFGKLTADTLTNENIYQMLHESHHAIIGGKHFKQYDATDVPPYNTSMTCTDSVMSYRETCPPVAAIEAKEFPQQVSRNDKRPEVQKKIAKVLKAFPTTLGPSDIDAAKEFTTRWNAQNEAAKNTQPAPKKAAGSTRKSNAKQDERTYMKEHGELFRASTHFGKGNRTNPEVAAPRVAHFLLDWFVDWLVDSGTSYANDVVKECPTWFKDRTYISNTHANLFTMHSGAAQLCGIGYNCTPMLGR